MAPYESLSPFLSKRGKLHNVFVPLVRSYAHVNTLVAVVLEILDAFHQNPRDVRPPAITASHWRPTLAIYHPAKTFFPRNFLLPSYEIIVKVEEVTRPRPFIRVNVPILQSMLLLSIFRQHEEGRHFTPSVIRVEGVYRLCQ